AGVVEHPEQALLVLAEHLPEEAACQGPGILLGHGVRRHGSRQRHQGGPHRCRESIPVECLWPAHWMRPPSRVKPPPPSRIAHMSRLSGPYGRGSTGIRTGAAFHRAEKELWA